MTGVSLNGVIALLAGAGVGANVGVGSGVMIKTGACTDMTMYASIGSPA